MFLSGMEAVSAKLVFVSDILSTSAPSLNSNHTIQFTSSGTIPVSGKIAITPQVGAFTIPGALDFTDIDITDDGVNLSLGGAPGSGVGSSLGVSVISGASGSIIFTLNDTDVINQGSVITIKIGTNASAGALGDKQIQNPAATGSYKINIQTKTAADMSIDGADTMVAIISPVNINARKAASPVPPPPPPLPSPPPPSPGGGGGGGGAPSLPPAPGSKVILSGQTSPFAYVSVLRDGRIAANTFANSLGLFSVRLDGLPPGQAIFNIFARDRFNKSTLVLQVTAFLPANAETVISNIQLSPTVELAKTILRIPDRLVVRGETFPLAMLKVVIEPGGRSFSIASNIEGYWNWEIPTLEFAPGIYTLKVLSKNEAGKESIFSELHEFTLIPSGPVSCRGADLNGDGLVNLTDLSIMLKNWGTNPRNVCADINGDKKVNLIDFSILLHYWSRRGR